MEGKGEGIKGIRRYIEERMRGGMRRSSWATEEGDAKRAKSC